MDTPESVVISTSGNHGDEIFDQSAQQASSNSGTEISAPEGLEESVELNICDLPECALLRIFHFVDIRTLVLVVRKTCHYWHYLSFDRSLWKVLKLDNGGLGEKMGDVSFLKMLAPIADLVEEIVFGFTMLLTDDSFMHKDIFLTNIKSLDFSLTNVTINTIVYLTEKYPKLSALNLNHCSYINIYRCLDFVIQFQDLRYLSFEDFACPADDTKLNNKILKTFQCCQNLTCCDIYATELSDETLSGIFECSTKLQELDLTGADKLTSLGFRTLNKDIHNLTSLSIAYTMINDKGLQIIAENSPKLKMINIMSCIYITDVGIGYIAANCKELESFLVNKTDPEEKGCSITSNGLETVALGCPKLKTIFVNYCLLIDDKCIIAVASNCPSLCQLRLAGCTSITDASLIALGQHSRFLRDLEVSECAQLTSKGVSFLMARCIWLQCLSLETCHRVGDLTISENLKQHGTMDEADDSSVSKSFCQEKQDLVRNDEGCSVEVDHSSENFKQDGDCVNNTTMSECQEKQILVSKDEDCSPDQVEADHNLDNPESSVEPERTPAAFDSSEKLLLSLQNHSHLQSLHLSFCSKITNDTLIEISKHCPDLQELSLRGCHLITDLGIASLVRSCKFIKILDLSGGSSFFSMKISNVSLSAIAHDCLNIERLIVSKNKLINLSGLEVLFIKCKSLESLELTVGEPMYASFSGVMSLVNNIKDRIVKIANHVQVIANKQSGNLHIEFYPNPDHQRLNNLNNFETISDEDLTVDDMNLSSITQ